MHAGRTCATPAPPARACLPVASMRRPDLPWSSFGDGVESPIPAGVERDCLGGSVLEYHCPLHGGGHLTMADGQEAVMRHPVHVRKDAVRRKLETLAGLDRKLDRLARLGVAELVPHVLPGACDLAALVAVVAHLGQGRLAVRPVFHIHYST